MSELSFAKLCKISKALSIISLIGLSCSLAADDKPYSPYVDIEYPQVPLWGDTHLHTSLSADAVAFGTMSTAEEAYRLAKGEQVTNSKGLPIKLSRPLDFLVVADHAEAYGLIMEVIKGNEALLKDERVARWREMILSGQGGRAGKEMIQAQSTGNLPDVIRHSDAIVKGVWEKHIKTAEKHNIPGQFTAFLGFEWTSLVQGNNLHRVVVFKDGKDKAGQFIPLNSNVSGMDPQGLWDWMANYESTTDGDVLAIPHNGNLSNGMMFAMSQFDGSEMTEEYAAKRFQWEPIVEVTQIKGDSESHPFLSPNDEYADFYTWDAGNLSGSQAKEKEMLKGEYAREALKNGLVLEQRLGVNPFKFGMIGATDSHTGVPSAEEDNYYGKSAPFLPSKKRWIRTRLGGNLQSGWEYNASGLAAVWAKENTREAIFDAMLRKEVYATTGPRMTVRLFAGWDFTNDDLKQRDIAGIGYKKGVPMGGDINAAPKDKKPSFLISAAMDPKGATLDRVQVVKGWVDNEGQTHEKVFNVAWAGDRQLEDSGQLPSVGNTVDVATASWTNDIGAPELKTVWQDPSFDPDQQAFYYLRVLEIPTPRWTAYDAYRLGFDLPKEVPVTLQERAYSSPIWYTP